MSKGPIYKGENTHPLEPGTPHEQHASNMRHSSLIYLYLPSRLKAILT